MQYLGPIIIIFLFFLILVPVLRFIIYLLPLFVLIYFFVWLFGLVLKLFYKSTDDEVEVNMDVEQEDGRRMNKMWDDISEVKDAEIIEDD